MKLSKMLFTLVLVLCITCLCTASALAAPKPTAEPEGPPTEEQLAAVALMQDQAPLAIAELGKAAKSVWAQEMFGQATVSDVVAGKTSKKGATPVTATVTFPLFNSGISEKTKYDGSDPQAFVADMVKSAAQTTTYALKATVAPDKDGALQLKWDASKGTTGLKTAITTKAKAAAASFQKKIAIAAICDLAFPHAVRVPKIDVTGGLSAIQVTGVLPDLDLLHVLASEKALSAIAYSDAGRTASSEDIDKALQVELDARFAAFKKSKASAKKTDPTQLLTFDLRKLADQGPDACPEVSTYHTQYGVTKSVVSTRLLNDVEQLPDYPAQERPKTGQLQGKKSGTRVVIRREKDAGDCCVRFTRTKTGESTVLAYIRDGEKITIYLPEGKYAMEVGSGNIWYGPEHTFGPDGTYGTDPNVSIASREYYHTFTLSIVRGAQGDEKGLLDGLNAGDFSAQ